MTLLDRVDRETEREYALRTIKANIISMELAPGSTVSENELSREIGVSRTPVREALMELHRMNVVRVVPQKRSSVAPIDFSLVEEAFFVRRVLECAVVELACSMARKEDLISLELILTRQTFAQQHGQTCELLEQDRMFHRTLFEIAHKTWSFDRMQDMQIHLDRVNRLAMEGSGTEYILEEHRKILEAVGAGDAAAARKAMEEHLDRCRPNEEILRTRYPAYFKDPS